MSYDPLVHNYVKGKMIGGCLGLVLGVCLIVLGSCLSSCQPIRPVPPLPHDIAPHVVPAYKCERWHSRYCQLAPNWRVL